MRSIESIRQTLSGLNGKDYGAYQSLLGSYSYSNFELHIDQIPKDPYAPPHTGIYRTRVSWKEAGFVSEVLRSTTSRIAFRDFLARQVFANSIVVSQRRGTGNSGIITVAEPGQEILERTSVVVDEDHIEARIFLGLPANGRKIRTDIAETMFFEELPGIINSSLFAAVLDLEDLEEHLQLAEDTECLRDQLKSQGLVAFIPDNAVLPRISGVDPRPLDSEQVVRFKSPENLRVTLKLPIARAISGMGIPRGVTLLVGGGYHGKSTLLQALELGVYTHIAGDGRKFCVSVPETVKVRAYSGRSIVNTDISPFIQNIPHRQGTVSFSSSNASGSTSQAAFISESIEAGAEVLLMDEDTCATNFLIRDKRMQHLVKKEFEPITAFIDRVRDLFEMHGISTVLVLGGSGDYLEVADQVIQMIEYKPYDVTIEAKKIVEQHPSERVHEGGKVVELPRIRYLCAEGLDTRNEHGHRRISSPNPRELIYGQMQVDLNDVEQLLEPSQVKAIGLAIEYARPNMDNKTSLRAVIDDIISKIESNGLDLIDLKFTGDLAAFRKFELAAVLNRMRDLQASQLPGE